MLIRLGGAETEAAEEEYDQLPSHEIVSEDSGTDEEGKLRRWIVVESRGYGAR